jgi:hypothetical protein
MLRGSGRSLGGRPLTRAATAAQPERATLSPSRSTSRPRANGKPKSRSISAKTSRPRLLRSKWTAPRSRSSTSSIFRAMPSNPRPPVNRRETPSKAPIRPSRSRMGRPLTKALGKRLAPSDYSGFSNISSCSLAAGFGLRIRNGLPTTPSTCTPDRAAFGTKMR